MDNPSSGELSVIDGLVSLTFWCSFSRSKFQRAKSLIISFSGGSIAGIPLCCQQRRGACTRLEHGAPFLVRAPQR